MGQGICDLKKNYAYIFLNFQIAAFKKTLYPQNIKVGQDRVEAPLQDVVNLTIERLFQYLGYWQENENKKQYAFDFKMGFDTTTAPGLKHKMVDNINKNNNPEDIPNAEESTSEESDDDESDENDDNVDEADDDVDEDSENVDEDEDQEEDLDESDGDSRISVTDSDDEIEEQDKNTSDAKKTDLKVREHIIVTLLVPIRLKNKDTDETLWQNPMPHSSRFCRPLRLNFVKDTNEVTFEEKELIDKDIDEFVPLETPSGTVECNFKLTMLDGKVKLILFGRFWRVEKIQPQNFPAV